MYFNKSSGKIILKRFQILSLLGEGGMGKVFLVREQGTGKKYAIKSIDYNLQGWKEKSVFEEVSGNDGIPDYYGYEIEDGKLYLIMEYLQGMNMREYIRVHGMPNCKRYLKWGIQLCQILEWIHKGKNKIVYMDLKPENIMIHSSKKLYLVDFGASVYFGENNTGCGTKGFTAPEQYIPGHKADVKADIFSLGKILDYCCPEKMRKKMGNIIGICTSKSLDKRYKDVKDVEMELLKLVKKERVKKQIFCAGILIIFIQILWKPEKKENVSFISPWKSLEKWENDEEGKKDYKDLWRNLYLCEKDSKSFFRKKYILKMYITYEDYLEKYGSPLKKALKIIEDMEIQQKKSEKEFLLNEKVEIYERLANKGEKELFVSFIQRYMKKEEEPYRAWNYYRRYLLFQEEHGKKIYSDYEIFIKKYPHFPDAYIDYCIYLCRYNQWEKAKQIYRKGKKKADITGNKASKLKERLGL